MSKYKRKDTIMSEENMLTLEKFEEASEKVKEAIYRQTLFTANI